MKKAILAAVAIIACLTLQAKRIVLTGEQASRDVKVSGQYETVSVGNDIEVRFSSQCKQAHITADKALMPYIKLIVDGNKLTIRYEGKRINVINPRKIRSANATVVTLPWNPKLKAATASSAASVQMDDCIKGETFAVNLSGAACFYGRLEVSDLHISASGAAEVDIDGVSRTFDAVLSGACNIDADKFVTSIAKVNLSGASNARIAVNGTIKGNISGASNLHCYGPADVQNVNCSGAGRVIRHK